MENENCLPGSVSAAGWFGLERVGTQKKLFDSSGRVDVEGAGDMPTIVLVIKPTVDDVVRCKLAIKHSVKEIVQLVRN